jgi:hypothetical protein
MTYRDNLTAALSQLDSLRLEGADPKNFDGRVLTKRLCECLGAAIKKDPLEWKLEKASDRSCCIWSDKYVYYSYSMQLAIIAFKKWFVRGVHVYKITHVTTANDHPVLTKENRVTLKNRDLCEIVFNMTILQIEKEIERKMK